MEVIKPVMHIVFAFAKSGKKIKDQDFYYNFLNRFYWFFDLQIMLSKRYEISMRASVKRLAKRVLHH